MTPQASAAAQFVDREAERFEHELREWLRIPSISTDPHHRRDVEEAAQWAAAQLGSLGFPEVDVVATDGHPIVWARDHRHPGAPTVLTYGHYDVQPAGPLEPWDAPPFTPTRRGTRLFARGATDDKGQVHMHLKAVETLRALGNPVPVNFTFLLEGEEEVGSPNLAGFVTENADRLACDGIVISDSEMVSAQTAAIEVGFRGIAYLSVTVRGPRTDLHSGVYGGAVVNPVHALVGMLCTLHDANGRVAVPGFFDEVRDLDPLERAAVRAVPFDDSELLADVGATAFGEPGFSTRERIWCRPSLDLHGLQGGPGRHETQTVIPRAITAKLSARLVPTQEPERIAGLVENHLRDSAPPGVAVSVRHHAHARPWVADPGRPWNRHAATAIETVLGTPPQFTRGGGSIPIVPLLEETLDAPVLLLGFGLPGSNPHGPNEWLDMDVYRRGIVILAEWYRLVGTHPSPTGA